MTRNTFFLILCLSLICANCVPRQKIVYFNEVETNQSFQSESFSTVIKSNDILGISVYSANMESVKDFNKFSVEQSGAAGTGSASAQGYLVGKDGTITFPVLGTLTASGLSTEELEVLLKNKLSTFSTDALVDVRILNYKITVLGQVNAPGTYRISDERISILQAIGLAGDLALTGQRENILILRNSGDTQQTYRIDLTSSDLLESPLYYLQQNDVVYVEPNDNTVNSTAFGRNTGLYLSIASLLLTLTLLFVR